MPNFIDLNYGQTGQSKKTNSLGMREMQERAYALDVPLKDEKGRPTRKALALRKWDC